MQISQDSKTATIRRDDEYAGYIVYECGIHHPSDYHKLLIHEGYLEEDPIEVKLNSMTVVDLKTMAKNLGILQSGKKMDIILRILANADASYVTQYCPETFSLSDKGKRFLDDHYAYVQLHKNRIWNIKWKEYDLNHKPGESFEDTVIGILERRAAKDIILFGRQEYYYLYQVYLRVGDRSSALENLLKVLYIDVSGSHGFFDFQNCGDKQMLKNKSTFHIMIAPGIIEGIENLRDVYSDAVVRRVYNFKLPIQICNSEMFLSIVHSILLKEYNKEEVMTRLEKAYCEYADNI